VEVFNPPPSMLKMVFMEMINKKLYHQKMKLQNLLATLNISMKSQRNTFGKILAKIIISRIRKITAVQITLIIVLIPAVDNGEVHLKEPMFTL
jgi:hypothetical protein